MPRPCRMCIRRHLGWFSPSITLETAAPVFPRPCSPALACQALLPRNLSAGLLPSQDQTPPASFFPAPDLVPAVAENRTPGGACAVCTTRGAHQPTVAPRPAISPAHCRPRRKRPSETTQLPSRGLACGCWHAATDRADDTSSPRVARALPLYMAVREKVLQEP